jgi:hypothetical protein
MNELFLETKEEIDQKNHCANCNNILGVKFRQIHYFCKIQGKGRFGKKIKKSDLECMSFIKAEDERIPIYDGYYGGKWGEGQKRGVKRRESK